MYRFVFSFYQSIYLCIYPSFAQSHNLSSASRCVYRGGVIRPPGSMKTLISRGSQAPKNKLSPFLTMYGHFPECVPICVLIVHLQYASSTFWRLLDTNKQKVKNFKYDWTTQQLGNVNRPILLHKLTFKH